MDAQVEIKYPKEVKIQYIQEVQSPLIIGVSSVSKLSSQTKETLKNIKPYAVILMSSNISDYRQTKELIKEIKEYGKGLGIKIKIAVDEEGGMVSRLSSLKGYPKEFKGLNDDNLSNSKKHSTYLKDIGIDINFAPVADIASNTSSAMYGRSLQDKPEEVKRKVEKIINIYKEDDIECTLKHFPGLGQTFVDSHEQTPTVSKTFKQWKQTDAIPFTSSCENIMTGHVIYPKIDKNIATYSKKWISILREDLKFSGNIISDDLKMGALGNDTDYSVRISKAYNNGITNPLIILEEEDMNRVFKGWIKIEKAL